MRYASAIAILAVIGLLTGVILLARGVFVNVNGTGSGTLQGTVWSYGCPATKPGEPCGSPAADYDVTVYRPDGMTVFARTKTDANGFYTVTLPEGTYTVYGDCHIFPPCTNENGIPHEVTIRAGQVTVLNVTYDNGIR